MRRVFIYLGVVAVLGLTASCASRVASPGATPTTPAASNHAAAHSSSPSAVPFDQQFIDMMVPHHQGAVEMARIAQTRAQHPEIKAMADDIISSQASEIDQMKAWRKAWFGSDQTPPMSQMVMVEGMSPTDHALGATMNMAQDVENLRTAPEPFDRAFIEAMIPHHQDAVAAAKAAESRAQRQEIKDLAKAIIAAQEREISQLRQWQQEWFGSPTSGTPHHR